MLPFYGRIFACFDIVDTRLFVYGRIFACLDIVDTRVVCIELCVCFDIVDICIELCCLSMDAFLLVLI